VLLLSKNTLLPDNCIEKNASEIEEEAKEKDKL
jgi:hypothetical protein